MLSWCLFVPRRRLPSGLEIARKYASAFPRVASCDFASQSDLRSGYPRLRSAQQSGLPRKLSPMTPCSCVPHRARRFKAATSSLLCRHTGRVTAAKQHPSGRLRRCPTGSAYAERKARRFSAKQARRKSAALFLPAPSVLNRPCFCVELRARADSPRFAAVCPYGARRPAAALVVRGKSAALVRQSAAIERGSFGGKGGLGG